MLLHIDHFLLFHVSFVECTVLCHFGSVELRRLGSVLNINALCINARNIELTGKCVHFYAQLLNFLRFFQSFTELRQLLAFFILNVQRYLEKFVEESANFAHVLLHVASGRYGRGANSDAARRHCRLVADDCVLVEGDMHLVAGVLHLGASEPLIDAAHEDHVVVRAISDQFVAAFHQLVGEGLGVQLHLMDVLAEFRCGSLLQLSRQSSNLRIVWTALAHGEDAEVDLVCDFCP